MSTKGGPISTLTKDCPRDDCSIEVHDARTTLIGWTQIYDKHGRPQQRDPSTGTKVPHGK